MSPSEAALDYDDLEALLKEGYWKAADQATSQIMQQVTHRQGWLDMAAVINFPCQDLHKLDQLWRAYSYGKFGFSAQQKIYLSAPNVRSFNFSREVGWVLYGIRFLGFFKFYNQLTFNLDNAPEGHLPALWFWRLSWRESWRVGGFGPGRGAGYGDAQLLDACMLRLNRCSGLGVRGRLRQPGLGARG